MSDPRYPKYETDLPSQQEPIIPAQRLPPSLGVNVTPPSPIIGVRPGGGFVVSTFDALPSNGYNWQASYITFDEAIDGFTPIDSPTFGPGFLIDTFFRVPIGYTLILREVAITAYLLNKAVPPYADPPLGFMPFLIDINGFPSSLDILLDILVNNTQTIYASVPINGAALGSISLPLYLPMLGNDIGTVRLRFGFNIANDDYYILSMSQPTINIWGNIVPTIQSDPNSEPLNNQPVPVSVKT